MTETSTPALVLDEAWLDRLQIGILTLDGYRVVHANHASAELLGTDPGQLIGCDIVQLLPSNYAAELRSWLKEVVGGSGPTRQLTIGASNYAGHMAYGLRLTMGSGETDQGGTQMLVLDRPRIEEPIEDSMDLPAELRYTLNALMDGNPVPTFVINADHVVIHWNGSCEAILGMGAEKGVGTREHWRAFHPTARPILADLVLDEISPEDARKIYRESLRSSSIVPDALEASGYFPHMGPQGRWLQFTAARIRDSQGRGIGAIETLVDVSERTRAEQALRQSRVKLEELVAQRTARLEAANQELEADIARRERDSQRAREFLAAILDSIPIPLLVKDEAGRLVLVNRAAEEFAARPRTELLGKTDYDFFSRDRAESYREEDQRAFAAEHPLVFDGTYVTLSGQSRWVIRSKSAVHFADGSTVLLTGLTDITERKAAESESQRAQQFLEGLINALSAAIFVKDQEHRWVLVNDAFAATTGRTRQDLIGKSDPEVFTPARAEGNWIEDDKVRVTKVPIVTEEMIVDAEGCEHWYLKTKSVIRFVDGTEYVVGIRTDITERKHTESDLLARYSELTDLNIKLSNANERIHATQGQLVESEKLASIGQLAAGVAHEINNPIGYVFSNFGTLERYLVNLLELIDAYVAAEPSLADESVRTALCQLRDKIDLNYTREDTLALMRESREGIERVRKIVQDLKDFSHVDASSEWQSVDLHRGLESTLNVVNNEIKYHADIVRQYGDIPPIQCLPSELNQVFLNLLVNAAHALEGGPRGTITVRTGCDEEFVWVEVEDNGCGIPADKVSRIFDPFFTTKAIGKGTGLGLALSYGIVQKHHGRIEVTTKLEQGTTFRVVLPIHQTDMEAKAA